MKKWMHELWLACMLLAILICLVAIALKTVYPEGLTFLVILAFFTAAFGIFLLMTTGD